QVANMVSTSVAAAPSICAFFLGTGSTVFSADLTAYQSKKIPILPIVEQSTDAARLPPSLAGVNAFVRARYRASWHLALCDEPLAGAWTRRDKRKVFISYRRADSASIARQVHDALTGIGFDVFLDEVTITRGGDIRQEITWWLNDADLVMLLVSPNLDASP